jgi:hypothetical protein
MTRAFTAEEAVRGKLPLIGGIMGPSHSGKTFSALRLATGIQRVNGGDIYVIDTEAQRSKHYADKFKFRHVPFGAPFDPEDYLAAIEFCVKSGAGVIIVDSASHMWEGEGGVLEQHDAESKRLAQAWRCNENATNFPAWAVPKAKQQRLTNTIVQLGVSTIFCFRAKEKTKPVKRGDVVDGVTQEKAGLLELGWMPIADVSMVYEMGFNLLLEPMSDGKPNINPTDPGTRRVAKLPGQFRGIITGKEQLSEDIGEKMAKWYSGEAVAPVTEKKQVAEKKATDKQRGNLEEQLAKIATLSEDDKSKWPATVLALFTWEPDERKKLMIALKEP